MHLYTVQQSLSLLLPGSSLDQRLRVLNWLHSTSEQIPSPTHSSTIRSVCVWEKRSESFSNRSWMGGREKRGEKEGHQMKPFDLKKKCHTHTHTRLVSLYQLCPQPSFLMPRKQRTLLRISTFIDIKSCKNLNKPSQLLLNL